MWTVCVQLEVSIDRVVWVKTVPDDGNEDEGGIDEETDDPDITLVLLPRQVPQADNPNKQTCR